MGQDRQRVEMKRFARALGMSLASAYRWWGITRLRLRLLLATQPGPGGYEIGSALVDAEEFRRRQIGDFDAVVAAGLSEN